MKLNFKSIDLYFFLFLTVLITLPFLAPIFLHFGMEGVSKIIYFIYSFFCHQFHHRSYHIFDNQCAWCARDTGIWIGVLAAAVLYKVGLLNKLKWWLIPVFAGPILLDGGFQTIATLLGLNADGTLGEVVYLSNNFTRFMTGAIFGTGLGLFLVPNIIQQNYELLNNTRLKRLLEVSKMKIITALLIFFLVLHIVFVGIWSVTSNKYVPTNFLDSQPRKEAGFFFVRRQNAICPTNEVDLFNFECLLHNN